MKGEDPRHHEKQGKVTGWAGWTIPGLGSVQWKNGKVQHAKAQAMLAMVIRQADRAEEEEDAEVRAKQAQKVADKIIFARRQVNQTANYVKRVR